MSSPNPRLQVQLTPVNLVVGVVIVVLCLAVFTWLLPMFMPAYLIQTVAATMIGILAWFLFMLSRG